jgi:amino acid adenylation domain-containing protein
MAAYVMFTSGSMGQPKGVVIAHRGVVRLVKDTNYIDIGSDDVLLQLSNIAFDASTFEVWGALLNGARLVVYEQPWFDPHALAQILIEERVSILWLTAALFHLIARQNVAMFAPLRVLLAGGDVLRAQAVNAVLDAHENLCVINGYGPTENTTFTCCHRMTRSNRPGADVPIGRAICGTVVHVLDAELRALPDGEVGELCTSGLGVALGYLDAPAATSAVFITHPGVAGTLYRTGDMVRRQPDGQIDYLGRRDRVVKIRGFRVALDEVQMCIARLPGVEESLVHVARDANNDSHLAALIQSQRAPDDMASFVKRELRKVMPPFMVPDSLTICTQLPLNANGKLDRKFLQQPANGIENAQGN